MNTKGILMVLLVTALLLMIPLVAMQVTTEVHRTISDFIVMGALLLAAGFGFLRTSSKTTNMKHKFAIGLIFLLVLLIIRVELAVGIFD